MQQILASHSRVAGGPELVFTGRIAELYRQMSADHGPEYSARLGAFFDAQELAAAFRNLFDRLFSKLRDRKPGAAYLSEKTPSNIFAASQLLELFPDSRFIHVLRDGRDVLASHRDVARRYESRGRASWNRRSFRLHRVCARWNRAAEVHFELADQARLAGRYLAVKYEDLVRDTAPVLTTIFDFLELEVEAATLTPEALTEEAGIPVDGIWTTGERRVRGFDPSRIGRWRRSLPVTGRVLGSMLMAPNLRRLSYPVSETSVRVGRVVWGIKRTIRRQPPYRCAPAPRRPSGRSESS